MRYSKVVDGPQKHADAEEAKQHNGRRRRVWFVSIMLAASVLILLLTVAGVTYYVGLPKGAECEYDDYGDYDDDAFPPLNSSEPRIVPFSSWSHRARVQVLPLAHPTPYVVIKSTNTQRCYNLTDCAPLLRAIQKMHWDVFEEPEISYSFLIDSGGNVYEGRGWNGTNSSGRFSRLHRSMALHCSVDVALIGNYMAYEVSREMASALWGLLAAGVDSGVLAPDYRLLAHDQVMDIVSPGYLALRAIARSPHRCRKDCDRAVVCIRPNDSDVTSNR